MEQIKLVLVDLDGTLLNDEKNVSEYTIEILKHLKEKGIRFGICTGRTPYAVKQLLPLWHIEQYTDLIIGFNGGMIMDLKNDTCESIYELDGKHIQPILDFLQGQPCNAYVYDQNELHTMRIDHHAKEIAKRNLLSIVVDALNPYHTKTINKLLTSWEKEDLDAFLQTHTLDHPDYYMVRSTPVLLEFMDPRVSKGQGIARLCEKTGISQNEILSFGDELNDLDMLQETIGVAMENGNPLLFEHTKYKASSNNEDGVATFIEQHLLNDISKA